MIRLSPAARPDELTDEKIRELTDRFKADKSLRVWNEGFITKALLKMSAGKCCYCECNIEEESKYMEVEHFHPKSIYEDEVVIWENLLPSCKRCNGNKRDHDTISDPIVHPVNDDPKEHLEMKAYRFYGKTEIGKMTISVVELNDRQRLQLKRFKIGSKTAEELNELEGRLKDFLSSDQTPRKRRNIISKLRNIMEQGQPDQEYSATVATEILREGSYHFAKTELTKLGFWDNELQNLEDELNKIAF